MQFINTRGGNNTLKWKEPLLDTTTKNLASMRSYSVKQFANSWSENIDN